MNSLSSSSSAPTIPCSSVEAASFYDGSWIINDYEPINIEDPLHAFLWKILSSSEDHSAYTFCSKQQREWCKQFGATFDKKQVEKYDAGNFHLRPWHSFFSCKWGPTNNLYLYEYMLKQIA